MSSARKEIRNAIAARLIAALPELDGRVYTSRAAALDELDLPCACVYTRDESVESIDTAPALQTRTLSLAVEICVKGNSSLDDSIDDLAEKVEAELLATDKQREANGIYSSIEIVNTEIGFVEMGRKPIGAGRLTFEITYEKMFT